MKKAEFDFLSYTNFPSSLKLDNDESTLYWGWWQSNIPVKSGAVTVQVSARKENVLPLEGGSRVVVEGSSDGVTWKWLGYVDVGVGSFGWKTYSGNITIPSGIVLLRVVLRDGAGLMGKPAITWFDGLRVYQDDELIYANDFSNWDPMIGAGIGAPIGGVAGYLLKEPLGPMVSEAVGAVLGGALGGGVGLLTGMGIIPVPQIPGLGAAPEGPVAPARLGKYLITG